MSMKKVGYKSRCPAPEPGYKMGPVTELLSPVGCSVDEDAHRSKRPRAASLEASGICPSRLWRLHLPLALWSLLLEQEALSKKAAACRIGQILKAASPLLSRIRSPHSTAQPRYEVGGLNIHWYVAWDADCTRLSVSITNVKCCEKEHSCLCG